MIQRAIILVCMVIGVGLITLMFRASSNNTFLGEYYTWLFGLGLALTAGLLVLIAYQIFSLVRKLRRRVFGSKLALRLMAVFALMAMIPGGLVYGISVQFLNRSIDSWFDVPVDKALSAALSLSKGALNASLVELTRAAQEAAAKVALGDIDYAETLKRARNAGGFDEIALFAVDGTPLASASATSSTEAPKLSSPAALFTDKPTPQELRDADMGMTVQSIETVAERGFLLRAVVPVPTAGSLLSPLPRVEGRRLIQVVRAAPKAMATDAQTVEAGFNDYARLGLQRSGLKRLFALTLTLAMLLTLFSALAISFLLSERLAAPLSALAESTRAIAKGDFSKLNPVKSRDEFGVLTQSFNTMTRQLGEASDVVARKQQELENANTYLESILGNLTSGVITLDERWYAKTINKNAQDMLGFDHQSLKGLKLPEWSKLHPRLVPLIDEIKAQLLLARDKAWERQIPFDGPLGQRTLLVRATKLPATIEPGFVFVFDDITGLIQAQRDAAWGEVARRLAHEIKNPLTPIQLSAERLQMKLADKLQPADRDMLARSTNTIVAQVGALKSMVDDFALYSRSSRLTPIAVSLNELVRDVLVLYESMNVDIEPKLQSDMPLMMADPALLRQVLHNLVQNALDALAGISAPRIVIETKLVEDMVQLVIEDNGCGIKEDVKTRIFEPYITTKPKGTGLGLAIVKKIIEEHGGRVSITNAEHQGARVEIVLPVVAELSAVTQAETTPPKPDNRGLSVK
jgi:nitrogen fixation/metabolism regulation signal transduction histidine kinase